MLLSRRTQRAAIVDRTFPAAAPVVWHSLPAGGRAVTDLRHST